MNATLRTTLILSLVVVTFGCKRGCTTSKTIDSETTTVEIGGVEIELAARLVEYKHSRRRPGSRNVFDRERRYSHGLDFDIYTPWKEMRGIMHDGCGDPDEIDLNDEVKRIRVEMSPGNKHFAYGLDDTVYSVLYIYQGVTFEPRSPGSIPVYPSFAEFDFADLEDPETIFRDGLTEENCSWHNFTQDEFDTILNALPTTDRAHFIMLEAWPDCSNATEFYTQPHNINRLKADPAWRQAAVDRALEALSTVRYGYRADDIDAFLAAVSDDDLTPQLDKVYAEMWGDDSDDEYNDYIFKRLKDQSNPMAPATRQRCIERADSAFVKYEMYGNSDYRMDLPISVQVMLHAGEQDRVELFVTRCTTPSFLNDNAWDIDDVFYDAIEVYPANLQQLIIDNTVSAYPSIKPRYRDGLYDFLKNRLTCQALRELITANPEGTEQQWPPNCGDNPWRSGGSR